MDVVNNEDQPKSQLEQKKDQEPLNLQKIGSEMPDQEIRQDTIQGHLSHHHKFQNEITTIDLMHSYDAGRVTFSEDAIKRMSQKLKNLKKTNSSLIDAEEEGNIQMILNALSQIELNHIDFYAQRQLTGIMKSLFTENKLKISNFTLVDYAKDLKRVVLSQLSDETSSIEKD